jgi:hypothetical protein
MKHRGKSIRQLRIMSADSIAIGIGQVESQKMRATNNHE